MDVETLTTNEAVRVIVRKAEAVLLVAGSISIRVVAYWTGMRNLLGMEGVGRGRGNWEEVLEDTGSFHGVKNVALFFVAAGTSSPETAGLALHFSSWSSVLLAEFASTVWSLVKLGRGGARDPWLEA
jgi:hypothetical protein